ncbi:MAG: Do family serine endopeptidase [Treponema sp.]|nr:Do family serine endopeptidase [Treponema sp.]MBQ5631564.1 Do family serine endopeptidase [Treponema sp.]MBQ5848703.1 Do family serine endopeptidase [Treponema sp.]MBQ5876493.1 Do family serine endopeptidase [Treponema sp.]
MKSWTKRIVLSASVAVLSFVLISFSCAKTPVKGTAGTVYAESDSGEIVSKESLKVIEALQNSFRSISNRLLPAVVEVDVIETKTVTDPFQDFRHFFFGMPEQEEQGKKRQYEQKGLGSGVIVRRTGDTIYVLTNNHVAGGATKITVKLNDSREFEAKLVGADARMDIALLSFTSSDKSIPVAKLGDSDAVQTGDICLAMGAPLGYSQSVTQGIVSAKGRSGNGIGNINDFIQTDAAINQGNSGGPLVNIYGEVIGINTWIASQSGGSQGIGFAIPINNIKNAINSFISKGKIVYGWLGVSLLEANKEYKEALGVEKETGALATQLFIGSPAQKAGMQPGDFIVSLNGHSVKDVDQLVREVGLLEAGVTANFEIIRNGKKIALPVKIEERSEKVSSDNGKLWPGFIAVPITEKVRKDMELENKVKGVVVSNVMEKSPAAALRLQNGDVITAVNGKSVTDLKSFYTELATADKAVNFDIYSNGGTITTGTYKF